MLLCLALTDILAVCKVDSRKHFFNGLSHTTILLSRRFWWGSQLLQRLVGVNEGNCKGYLTSRVCPANLPWFVLPVLDHGPASLPQRDPYCSFHRTVHKLRDLEYQTRLPRRQKIVRRLNIASVTGALSLQGNTVGNHPDPNRLSRSSEVRVATQQCCRVPPGTSPSREVYKLRPANKTDQRPA